MSALDSYDEDAIDDLRGDEEIGHIVEAWVEAKQETEDDDD